MKVMIPHRFIVVFGALTLALLSAAPLGAQTKVQDRLNEPKKVVATFSILSDLVKNVGGNRVAVSTLVGPNGDAHVYTPSPADAKKLTEAQLIVTNGLGFEGWINRLIKASGSKAQV